MYSEELYNLVDELDLKKDDADDMKVIIRKAINQYLLESGQNRLKDNLEFVVHGRYIEQSELLSKLGISADPESWQELFTDYGSNPFGPSDAVAFPIRKCKTNIVFPTSLFKEEKKENILKKVKSL